MPKWKVLVGLPSANARPRFEVLGWVIECQRVAHQDPAVKGMLDEELLVAPIQAFPTSVARNRLVDAARQHGADILMMVDDDSWPPAEERHPDGRLIREGWFKTALQFLASQPEPSMIAVPYCCGGPEEAVMVFEFTQTRTGAPLDILPATFGLTRVQRMDAARRRGPERVANIGTHCVAYDMRVFDRISKPYFAYQYNPDHTALVETEDCWCHRLLFNAGVPIYVHWDYWAKHHKDTWVDRPLPLPPDAIPEHYRKQAEANVQFNRPAEPTAKPIEAPDWNNGWDMNRVHDFPQKNHTITRLMDLTGPFAPPPAPMPVQDSIDRLSTNAPPQWSLGEDKRRRDEAFRQQHLAYNREAMYVGERPHLQPRNEPFPAVDAVAFARSVPGWMTEAELTWLAGMARQLNPGDVWIEVGVWKGRSYSAVTLSAPSDVLIRGIDRFDGGMEGPERAEAIEKQFMDLRDELQRLRPDVKLGIRPVSSADAAREIEPASASVVFLDAGPTVAETLANIDAWLPIVRPGCLLCGHDAYAPGVQELLKQRLGEVRLGPGSIWAHAVPLHSNNGEQAKQPATVEV